MGKYVHIRYAGENCLNITGKRMGFYDFKLLQYYIAL